MPRPKKRISAERVRGMLEKLDAQRADIAARCIHDGDPCTGCGRTERKESERSGTEDS